MQIYNNFDATTCFYSNYCVILLTITTNMNYSPVFELINYFKEYTEKYENDNLSDFSVWLKSKMDLNKSIQNIPLQSTFSSPQDMGNYSQQRLQTELEISKLLNRLYKINRIYHKSALGDIDIDFPDEINLLMEVQKHQQLTKSDLIEKCLLESTTGTEMIKRLIKNGYLSESVNKEDRRSRIVKLTTKGIGLLQDVFPKLILSTKLLGANLNQGQKLELFKLLGLINSFHSEILKSEKEINIEELVTQKLYN